MDPIITNQVLVKQAIDGHWDAMAQGIAAPYLQMFNLVWNHDALTPQQVADAIGAAKFVEMYVDGQTLKPLVQARKPGLIPDSCVAPCDGIQLDGGGNPVVNANGGPVLLFALTVSAPVGAAVTVNGQTLTAADGTATFAGLADGDYEITAACDGFTDAPVTVAVHRNTRAACGLVPVPPPPPDEPAPPTE